MELMELMELNKLFNTLGQIVKIPKNPAFPYDLYRYFNLLENLKDENQLSFEVIRDVQRDDLLNVSYDRIGEYNLSGSQGSGTFQTQEMKQKLKFIDQEAIEVAQSLIKKMTWPDNIQPNMESFIAKNSHAIQLYIRDIPTMVCAIFVFLVLRNKPNKISILNLLNRKISQTLIPKKQKQEKKEGEQKVEIFGKYGDNDEFLIVTVTGSKSTKGARCESISKEKLKSYLHNENITKEDIEKELGKKYTNKNLCQLLKSHLQSQKRWISSS